ncbi:MAG: serine/threonine protein kinase [Tidjanibacter sp.]|nr:serine/threonine protein kinase [Tidjanibacter sp.]
MNSESEIYEIAPAKATLDKLKLLRESAGALLYSTIREGKRLLIKTTKDKSEYQIRLLRREWEISIECNHPHIIHTLLLEDLPDLGPSIIMEYIEGCTLSEWLSTNPPQNERRRVFEELLTAVNYLHQRGIIHNDLKPDNILISRADNTLKLIDFGLADSDAHIALRRLGCTPKYASPELQARGDVDARSDIYSIGVIMGELFGAHHKRIAERCTKQQPVKRYANIAALQLTWQGRNRGIRILAALLLIAMVLPSLAERITDIGKERKRVALMEEINSEVENRYMLSADSIKMAHYQEFAAMIISHFYYDMWLYHTTKLPTIEPVELREKATNHYTLIVNPLNQQLWEDATALPSVHNSNLPREELDYYLELLRLGKPYESYSE